jgi:hypothetical protein
MIKKLNKTINIVFLTLLVFLATVPYAKALDKKAELKVYQRFFKATGAEDQYNQILNLVVAQLRQNFSAAIKDVIPKTENATQEEKEKIGQLLNQAMGSYFQKMRAKTAEALPLNELIADVYYPAFSKQFTVEEIDELATFFESPLGKKYISSLPIAMQESFTLINQKYMPQLQKISAKLAEEEMQKIKPEIEKIMKKK